MGTINFLYRSKKETATLTLRLLYRHSQVDYVLSAKTNILVSKQYWNNRDSNTRDASFRAMQGEVRSKTIDLEQHVMKAFSEARPIEVNKHWLAEVVSNFYDPEPERNENVVYWIQHIIDNANSRENGKGGIGLGKSRIQRWGRLLSLFIDFSEGKNYKVSEINVSVFKKFKIWLIDNKKYASTYATKNLADLKSALREARSEGVPVSIDFEKLPTKQAATYDDDMDVIPLTREDLAKIADLNLISESLINARKWLMIACYTGQRGEAITKRITKENFIKKGEHLVIRVIQKKGNKPIVIPVLPIVRDIYDQGLPYAVSTQKLNKHFKTLGEMAGICNPTMGRLKEKVDKVGLRGIKKKRPKWMYMSTHIGRRTFATIHFGELDIALIMAVTGHKKESTFLKYVNKSNDVHVDPFMNYYHKKELEKNKQAKLSLVKNSESA